MISSELSRLRAILKWRRGFSNLQVAREGLAAFMDKLDCPSVAVKDVVDGEIRGEWLQGEGEGLVFWVHGGGYCTGSPAVYRGLTSRITQVTQGSVFAVEYPLAPENPFPAAVDAVEKALGWLDRQVVEGPLTAGADSAGAGALLAALIRRREKGLSLPIRVLLVSPWVDLTHRADSIDERASLDPLLNREGLELTAAAYLQGTPANHPEVSPLFADLKGLPHTKIFVGSHECLFDDSRRLAEAMRSVGVKVDLEVWDSMIHVWPLFAAILPEGQGAGGRDGEVAKI